MPRIVHSLDDERLLWEREMARSRQDYELALRQGTVPDPGTVLRNTGHDAWQRCRALVQRSRLLCEESRVLREASRLLR